MHGLSPEGFFAIVVGVIALGYMWRGDRRFSAALRWIEEQHSAKEKEREL
jgi:hypothetical protein